MRIVAAFKFKIKHFEDWEKTLAKSAEEDTDTLGMTEDELDTTDVIMTEIQGDKLSFRQQVEKNQLPKTAMRLASPIRLSMLLIRG